MRSTLLLSIIALAGCHAARPDAHPHWSYEGEAGPGQWGHLSPEFAACAAGRAQSPIDLAGAKPAALPPLAFHYRSSPATATNDGHTVQVDLADGGTLEVGVEGQARQSGLLQGPTAVYRLVQFHFHHPSEHTVDGRPAPLELHLVHKGDDGKLAVVGVLFDEGAASDALAPLFSHLPSTKGGPQPLPAPVDASALLPADHASMRYTGSLTTPPCSEGVSWIVMTTRVTASPEQLGAFAALFPHDARPTQPRNDRPVETDAR